MCPVPGCPYPRLTTRGPAERRHHFVHLQAPGDPAHQRAYERQVATELLADWIRATHPQSTVETDVPVGEVSVTVLVTGPAGAKFAVVFVDRRLGVDAWWDEDLELERAGVARGWIFSPRRYLRYPQPAADAAPDDPAAPRPAARRRRARSSAVSGDARDRPVAAPVEHHYAGGGEPDRSQRPGRSRAAARPAGLTRSRVAPGARPA